MLTGQNGILNRAAEAKEKTEDSSDLEYLQTKAYEAITNYYVTGQTSSENEYILKELNNVSGVTTNVAQGTVKYNEKTYDISEIIGNTNEQKAIEKEKGLSLITASNVTDSEDKKILEAKDSDGNMKIRMIIAEKTTDNTTVKAVIPNGFYYVTGRPSTGLVISDKFGDDDNNTKGGNQFVWVPCNGEMANYELHKYASKGQNNNESVDDTVYSTEDTGNGNWKTFYYTKWSDWQDNGGETSDIDGTEIQVSSIKAKSVENYGGFYVGRYEAGEPINADFYGDKEGSTYWQATYKTDVSTIYGENDSNPNSVKKYDQTYKKKDVTTQDGKNLLPVSKKNTPAWNYISQKNSKIVSENMYGESKIIKSYLIDGTAWDTITKWIGNSEEKTKEGKIKSIKDSTLWGNYSDASYSITGLYAIHQNKNAIDGNTRWFPACIYNYGTYSKNKESEYLEIATGASDRNTACNIYDMAGNMWEWTTETRKQELTNSEAKIFAVRRGGSFNNGGLNGPISYRSGDISDVDYNFHIGFRVVFYIQ